MSRGVVRRTPKANGEIGFQTLAHWLNGPSGSKRNAWESNIVRGQHASGHRTAFNPERDQEARKHSEMLIDALKEQQRIGHLLNWKQLPSRDPLGWKAFEAGKTRLDKLLARYDATIRPRVRLNRTVLFNGEIRYQFQLPGIAPKEFEVVMEEPERSKVPSQEWWAFHVVTEALAKDRLWKLRRCDLCKVWFTARRIDQHFCSEKCRVGEYQSRPDYKQKRYLNHKRRLFLEQKRRKAK
jgi:hypothetical protein